MKKSKILRGLLAILALSSMAAATACDDILSSLNGIGGQHVCEWSEWSVSTDATCENDGEETRVCALDETHVETRAVSALGHDTQSHEEKPATCKEVGWNAYESCKRDGCAYTTYEEIGVLSHDIETHEEKPATCKETGWKVYETCKRDGCDYTTYEEIGLAEHDFLDGFCKTCSSPDPDYKASVGLAFTLSSDETYYIVSGIGTCTDSHIVIPDTYKNLPVKQVGASAFYSIKTLKAITLPKTLETIGKNSFRACQNLLSVVIPDNVTSIGEYAFENDSNLVHVTVGEKVTTISYQSFDRCYKLLEVCNKSSLDITRLSVASYAKRIYTPADGTSYLSMDENGYVFYTEGTEKIFVAYSGLETSVTIPEGVTSIYQYAFLNNSSLKSVEVPSTLTSVGGDAFSGCYNLQKKSEGNAYYLGNSSNPYVALIGASSYGEPTINAKTKVIANYAFNSCTKLTKIDVPKGVVSIGSRAFSACVNMVSVTIPDSVTSIGAQAFEDCYLLESVTIPDSVTSLGMSLFSSCKALKEVKIGKNVTSIDKYAFDSCYALESIVIPDSVKTIGAKAFYNCKALEKVTIGKGVELIGEKAFDSCSALKGVYITDLEAWCNITFTGDRANPLYQSKKLYLNDKLLTDLVIPEGVTQISKWAFNYCESLLSVVIPSTVTTIPEYAFSNCTNLISVELGENVSSILNNAFIYDSKLIEICNKSTLSLSLNSNANGNIATFAKNIYTPTKGESKLSTDENGFVIYTDGESKILAAYRGAQADLVLPDGITEVLGGAFYQCGYLTSVVIPDSVTTIGSSAFYMCENLMSVVIGSGVKNINGSAFSGDEKLVEIYNKSSLAIQAGKGSYGSVAAYAKNVYTPTDGVSKLSTDANGFVIYTDGESKVLVGYKGSQVNLVIPEGVTEIHKYAFAGHTNVQSVKISNTVVAIGDYAFADCSKITNVYYAGSESDWSSINMGYNNNYLKNATIHYGE